MFQHGHEHLEVLTKEGGKFFCEFADVNLVWWNIFNNSLYGTAYWVAFLCLMVIYVKFHKSFNLFFGFLWSGVAVFIFWCGIGHDLRALIFYTNKPFWFWIESRWETIGAVFSNGVAICMTLAAFKTIYNEKFAAVMRVSIASFSHLMPFQKKKKSVLLDQIRVLDESVSRLKEQNIVVITDD